MSEKKRDAAREGSGGDRRWQRRFQEGRTLEQALRALIQAQRAEDDP